MTSPRRQACRPPLRALSRRAPEGDVTPDSKDAAVTDEKLKLLRVRLGKNGKLVPAGSTALHEALTRAGIEHTDRLTGSDTSGSSGGLTPEVAPLLFR